MGPVGILWRHFAALAGDFLRPDALLEAPGPSQERSGGVPDALFRVLGAADSISERPRSDSDRPKPPKIDFVSIFARFGPILRRFFSKISIFVFCFLARRPGFLGGLGAA